MTSIHKLLGLEQTFEQTGGMLSAAPMDLPAAENFAAGSAGNLERANFPDTVSDSNNRAFSAESQIKRKKIFRSGYFLYPMVFVLAFAFFYGVLNFSSLLSQVSGWFAPSQDEQILGGGDSDYYAWINGYYFWVGEKEIIEPVGDIDQDGLTNLDEFHLKTNPTVADSDQDGFTDGVEVINSYNPWGSGRMTEEQFKFAQDLDMIKVSNRISYNASSVQNTGSVLGAVKTNFDSSRPGTLSIPKLGLQVPIIWSADPQDFEKDLTQGVVHYPTTAMPGEQGVMYVSGHSSDYPWKKHPYKQIFASLNALDIGDDVFIDAYDADGKLLNFRYRVIAEQIYSPDDQRQFVDDSKALLNLSTCWPIGSTKSRYIVSAVQVGL